MSLRHAGKTTLDHDIRKTTERAVMIVVNGTDVWIPRSACLDGEHLGEGDQDLVVANWWLRENGLL